MFTQLKKDMMNAKKEKDEVKSNLLVSMISEIQLKALNEGRRHQETEADCIIVMKKFLNSINESIEAVKKYNKDASSLLKEKAIIEQYLPKQLSEEDLGKIISELLKEAGDQPVIGTVMNLLKQKYAGQYDGKIASTLIKQKLDSLKS